MPLQDRLDAITARTRMLVQEERLAFSEQATAELFATGIEDRILAPGANRSHLPATGRRHRQDRLFRRSASRRSIDRQLLPRTLVPVLRHRARDLARPLPRSSAKKMPFWSPSPRRTGARTPSPPSSTGCAFRCFRTPEPRSPASSASPTRSHPRLGGTSARSWSTFRSPTPAEATTPPRKATGACRCRLISSSARMEPSPSPKPTPTRACDRAGGHSGAA